MSPLNTISCAASPLILSSMWCYLRCLYPCINICAVSPLILKSVQCPTLFICGVSPPQYQSYYYILCPSSNYNILHDTLSLAQLISSIVALSAKLVFSSSHSMRPILNLFVFIYLLFTLFSQMHFFFKWCK